MTTVPLPDLDKLHAETSAGEWRAGSVETDAVFAPCSDCMGPERVILRMNKSFPHEADAKWIASIHNTWPTISARLKEQDESVLELQEQVTALELERNERVTRMKLLEETLRGILQEKQTERHFVTGPGVVEHTKREALDRQIAWLESVLGGGK